VYKRLLEVTEAQVLEFLHPLPVARLWGVGPVTAKALAELGVTTIGHLATFEHDRLVGRFGSHGEQLFNLARGVDPRPVVPSRERKSISEEETFETDTENAEDVERVLRAQAEAVAQRLQRHQVMGRTITVKIKLNESLGQGHYRELSRSRTLPDGTQSPEVIFREACRLFAVVPREEHKVRLVGVQISTLEPMGGSRQLLLFSDTP